MRRNDTEITDRDKIDAIIRESLICRLALAKDNNPYLVPVSFGYDGKNIFLHTARTGKKINYFKNNDKVCVEFERGVRLLKNSDNACSWSFKFQSVIGFGRIIELADLSQKEYALNQIMLKYSGRKWQFDSSSLEKVRTWKIIIDSLTGKESVNNYG